MRSKRILCLDITLHNFNKLQNSAENPRVELVELACLLIHAINSGCLWKFTISLSVKAAIAGRIV